MPDTTKPSAEEVTSLQHALVAGRSGGASLTQLIEAHQLAEKHRLPLTTAELRDHIRASIPDRHSHVTATRSIMLGVASGIVTHYILRTIHPERFDGRRA